MTNKYTFEALNIDKKIMIWEQIGDNSYILDLISSEIDPLVKSKRLDDLEKKYNKRKNIPDYKNFRMFLQETKSDLDDNLDEDENYKLMKNAKALSLDHPEEYYIPITNPLLSMLEKLNKCKVDGVSFSLFGFKTNDVDNTEIFSIEMKVENLEVLKQLFPNPYSELKQESDNLTARFGAIKI